MGSGYYGAQVAMLCSQVVRRGMRSQQRSQPAAEELVPEIHQMMNTVAAIAGKNHPEDMQDTI